MPITAPLANAETEPARVRRRKRNRRASPYKSIDVDQFYCYRRRAIAQGGCAFPARLKAISRDSQGQRPQGTRAVTRAAARDVEPPRSSLSNQRQSTPTVPSTLPFPAPRKRFSQRWQPGCSVPGGTPIQASRPDLGRTRSHRCVRGTLKRTCDQRGQVSEVSADGLGSRRLFPARHETVHGARRSAA